MKTHTSDYAHQSMILRNGITPEKIAAMKASLERGKILIEKSRKLIERRKAK